MRVRSFTAGLALALGMSTAAHAQVTVDVAKISCQQFLLDKIAPTKSIALWLAGYYNGKRDNTVIDIAVMQQNVDKVEDYCRMHLEETVMKAAETVLDLKK